MVIFGRQRGNNRPGETEDGSASGRAHDSIHHLLINPSEVSGKDE